MVDPDRGELTSDITAALDKAGNSVDQRLKVSTWLEIFRQRGGKLRFGQLSSSELETIS